VLERLQVERRDELGVKPLLHLLVRRIGGRDRRDAMELINEAGAHRDS
jgi:hypothetical protein